MIVDIGDCLVQKLKYHVDQVRDHGVMRSIYIVARWLFIRPRKMWGRSTLEKGYVYAPYVPRVKIDVNEFMNKQGILSRYANKRIELSHYGNIKIKAIQDPKACQS